MRDLEGVAAVLLAAGESRRMGRRNKLTLPVAGQPLLRRSAEQLLRTRVEEIVVVLGHEAAIGRELLAGLPLRITENPNYREGQMTSVHWGLSQLTAAVRGVMICLADQPRLTSEDLGLFIDAYLNGTPKPVLVPVFDGQRGNPIMISYAQRETILAGNRKLGCRRLIDDNPELVTAWRAPNNHFTLDLDTPEQYRALCRRGAQAAVDKLAP